MVIIPARKRPYLLLLAYYSERAYMGNMDKSPLFSTKPAVPQVAYVRDLEETDILLLGLEPQGSVTPAIKKLNDRHHKVAQLLASGMKSVEVSAVTGMCQSRISILKNDPAFKELLAFYAGDQRSAAVDMLSRLGMLSAVVVEELTDRLSESPEQVTVKELVAVAKLAADRSGFGPTSKSQVQHVHVSAADIAKLKGEVAGGKVHILAPADRRTSIGASASGGAVQNLPAPTEVLSAEEGEYVREEGTPTPQAAE